MAYVDAFLVPVPKARLDDYQKMAHETSAVWKEYGAVECLECVPDDVPFGEFTSFPRAVQLKDDEVVVFACTFFESREHRDAVNARVMADPRMHTWEARMPLDGKRMIWGGFVPFMRV